MLCKKLAEGLTLSLSYRRDTCLLTQRAQSEGGDSGVDVQRYGVFLLLLFVAISFLN